MTYNVNIVIYIRIHKMHQIFLIDTFFNIHFLVFKGTYKITFNHYRKLNLLKLLITISKTLVLRY